MPYKNHADYIAHKLRWNAANKQQRASYYQRTKGDGTTAYGAKKKWLHQYKGERGCSRCTENDPYCLDLHHIDPKTKNSKRVSPISLRWDDMKAEVELCIVLCANCHRKEHKDTATGGRPPRDSAQ